MVPVICIFGIIYLMDYIGEHYTVYVSKEEYDQMKLDEKKRFSPVVCHWCDHTTIKRYYYNPYIKNIQHICNNQQCRMAESFAID